MKVLVQSEAFDLGAEVDAMRAGRTDIGAIASFVGLARDLNEGSGVQALQTVDLQVPVGHCASDNELALIPG